MNKNVAAVLVLVVIVVFGGVLAVMTLQTTGRREPEPSPSPTPVLLGDYELEGRITAASTAGALSPSPGTAGEVDSGITGTIDVRLQQIRGDFDGCIFEAGEVAIVRIVDATVFDPPTLISARSFPDNLIGESIESTGSVFQDPDEKCHLVAARIDATPERDTPSDDTTPTPDRTQETPSARPPSPRPTSTLDY